MNSSGQLISKWWDLVGRCECCGHVIVTQKNNIWQCWRCKIKPTKLHDHEACKKCKLFRIARDSKMVMLLLDRIDELLIYSDSYKMKRYEQLSKSYYRFGANNTTCYWVLDYNLIPLKDLFEAIRKYYRSHEFIYRWYDTTFLDNLPELTHHQHNTLCHLLTDAYNPFDVPIDILTLQYLFINELDYRNEDIQNMTTTSRINGYGKSTTIWVGRYWIKKFLHKQHITNNIRLFYLNFVLH